MTASSAGLKKTKRSGRALMLHAALSLTALRRVTISGATRLAIRRRVYAHSAVATFHAICPSLVMTPSGTSLLKPCADANLVATD